MRTIFTYLCFICLSVALNAQEPIVSGAIYRIACYDNTAQGFGIEGNGTTNLTKCHVWEWGTGSNTREYKIESVGDGYYKIIPQNATDKRLALNYNAEEDPDYTYVVLADDCSANEDHWKFESADGGYRIVNRVQFVQTGPSRIQLKEKNTNNGNKIVCADADLRTNDRWVLVRVDGSQSIPDGDYRVAIAKNTNYVADIAGGGSAESNPNVQLYKWNASDAQKWTFKHLGKGYYQILTKLNTGNAKDNELYMDSGSYGGGVNVRARAQSGNVPAGSKWYVKEKGNGIFTIQNQLGHYLDLDKGTIPEQDGGSTDIHGWQYATTGNQDWVIIPVDGKQIICDGIYRITSKCTDANGGLYSIDKTGNEGEGTAIHMWNDSPTNENQKWEVKFVPGTDYYNIMTKSNGFKMNVQRPNDGYTAYPTINQTKKNDVPGTRWIIRDAGDGYYYAINEWGYFLDLKSGSTNAKPGGEIGGWNGNSGDAEKWKFIIESIPVSIKNINGKRYSSLYCAHHKLKVPEGTEILAYTHENGSPVLKSHKTHQPGEVIPSNTGVIVHSTEREEMKTYYFQIADDETEKRVVDGNILLGNDETNKEITVGGGYKLYRLYNGYNGVGFYYPTTENGKWLKPGAHKAYFILADNALSSSNAPVFIGLEDDEETDIQALPEATSHKLQTTDEIYNLSGQRLQKMQRGINIVGGKKVVIM